MAREDPTIYMRIPADLKTRLDEAAAKARRSLTAEVVGRLQTSFELVPEQQVADLRNHIDTLEDLSEAQELVIQRTIQAEKFMAKNLLFVLDDLPPERQKLREHVNLREWAEAVVAGEPVARANAAMKVTGGTPNAAPSTGEPIVDKESRLRAGFKNAGARAANRKP